MSDPSALPIPDLEDIRRAAARIAPHLPVTPLYPWPSLSRLVGTDVVVKHENHLPTGAFKVRGGVNLSAQLSPDEKGNGLIAASTGNHGQSVAYGASIFGITARICVPEGANPLKVQAIKDLGAEVIVHGRDFDAAKKHCAELSEEHGYRYVNSGDEPHLIAGVATHALEMLDREPDIDVVIVPVGGGSGAAGAALAARSSGRSVQVIGVQSEASPSAYLSWKEGRAVDAANETFAEGLATGSPFMFPQAIMREHLDDFVLVTDRDIAEAQVAMIEGTRNLVEAAGASPLAAALQLKEDLKGSKVALICTGGNVTPDQLRSLLAR